MFRLRIPGIVIALIPALFIFGFFIIPILSLIALGLGSEGDGIIETLVAARTLRVIGQTFLQATTATIVSLLLGIPAAFTLYRLQFRGRKTLRAVLTVPFVLPTVVVAAAFLALYGEGGILGFLGLDQSFFVLVLALTFFNVTIVMRIVGGFWEELDPRQGEAARMLGASVPRVFLTITFPALLRPIASAAALVFLFCATSFGVVLILGGKSFANIETEIYRATMQLFDLKTAAVLSLVQILIVIIALFFSSKIKPKNSSSLVHRANRFRFRENWPVVTVFGATLIGLHAMPLIALVTRSLRDISGAWTLQSYTMLIDRKIFDSLLLSLKFAFLATFMAVVLGLIIAVVTSRVGASVGSRLFQRTLENLALMPLGVSAVTLGLGLLISMHKPLGIGIDLRSSILLIPIAQTLIALPLVVRTLNPRMQSISLRVKEAAAMLGASPLRILFTVELPLMRNAIGVAAGFSFAAALGEFGAAAFLVRGEEQTLPVVIAGLLTHPDPNSYGMGLAAAVLLGVLTATAMVLAENWGLKRKAGGALWK